MSQKTTKLENTPLWQAVAKLADYAEDLLSDLPEVERWGMESKLRARALDLTSNVAEAYGSIDPRDKKWLLGSARRDLFGLKNLLRVAHKRKYAKIDPDIMIAIDRAVDQIDAEIERATQEIPQWFAEMNPPARDKK